jgi:hypothetical protein
MYSVSKLIALSVKPPLMVNECSTTKGFGAMVEPAMIHSTLFSSCMNLIAAGGEPQIIKHNGSPIGLQFNACSSQRAHMQ